jgi:hypothetical protein
MDGASSSVSDPEYLSRIEDPHFYPSRCHRKKFEQIDRIDDKFWGKKYYSTSSQKYGLGTRDSISRILRIPGPQH